MIALASIELAYRCLYGKWPHDLLLEITSALHVDALHIKLSINDLLYLYIHYPSFTSFVSGSILPSPHSPISLSDLPIIDFLAIQIELNALDLCVPSAKLKNRTQSHLFLRDTKASDEGTVRFFNSIIPRIK